MCPSQVLLELEFEQVMSHMFPFFQMSQPQGLNKGRSSQLERGEDGFPNREYTRSSSTVIFLQFERARTLLDQELVTTDYTKDIYDESELICSLSLMIMRICRISIIL